MLSAQTTGVPRCTGVWLQVNPGELRVSSCIQLRASDAGELEGGEGGGGGEGACDRLCQQ